MNAGHQVIIDQLIKPSELWHQAQARHWSGGIDLSGADFRESALLDIGGKTLRGTTKFDGATFPDGFIFRDTVFDGPVIFSNAIFKGSVDFTGVKFNNNAFFDGCSFEGVARFAGIETQRLFAVTGTKFLAAAYFPNTHFRSTAQFSGTLFQHATFTRAQFHEDSSFVGAAFDGDANFEYAKFVGSLRFGQAMFYKDANFQAAEIAGVSFAETTFQGEALFTDATLAYDASFASCTFLDGAYFQSVERGTPIGYVNFYGATITGPTTFSNRRFVLGATFRGASFSIPPGFHQAELHQNTIFDCANYGDWQDADAELNFRTLKLAMHDQQSHREELLFFSLEMRAREYSEKRKDIRWLYSVYRRLSNYGMEWRIPAIWLLSVFLVCWFLYAVTLSFSNALDVGWEPDRLKFDLTVVVNALLLSATQVLPFMTVFKESIAQVLGSLHTYGWLYGVVVVLAIFETIISAVLLFLFGLALRNLFRLK
jgi:uncharacterized protein YjbI with pentapeptide repeats